MKRTTPATKSRNTPQKVLKSLEPMNTATINIVDTMPGVEVIQSLEVVQAFVETFDINAEYDVIIQVDKREPDESRGKAYESTVHSKDNKGSDNKD